MSTNLFISLSAILAWTSVHAFTINTGQGIEESGCYPGWIRYGTSCFAYGQSQVTWFQAAATCAAHGGFLAVPDSEGKNDFIKSFATDRLTNMWVGATDLFDEGTWAWVSTRAPLQFSDWAEGEPNNAKNFERHDEDCMVVNGRKNQWNDFNCLREYNYLCEVQLTLNLDESTLNSLALAVKAELKTEGASAQSA